MRFCCDAHSGIGVGFGGLGKSLRLISLVRNGDTERFGRWETLRHSFWPEPTYMRQGKSPRAAVFDRRGDVWIRGSDLRAPDGPARPAAKERIYDHGQGHWYRSRDDQFLRRRHGRQDAEGHRERRGYAHDALHRGFYG